MLPNLVITTEALKPPLTGIGYYTLNLIRELEKLPEMGDINGLGVDGLSSREQLASLVSSLDEMTAAEFQSSSPRHRLVSRAKRIAAQIPGSAMLLRKLYLRRCGQLMKSRPDHILHAPNFIAPPFSGRTVITVHDLSHIRHPETHPKERVLWLNQQLPRALAQADRIICVSEFTQRELLDLGLVKNEDKLRVCYNGLDDGFYPRTEAETSATLARWGLRHKQYLLSVGTLEPRKNLTALLDAYRLLPVELAAEFPLVLTGTVGWNHSELAEKIARLPAPYKVITTGYVDRTSLQQLLCSAALFTYLSIYEGFGLPVLEAMACGTPVLISDTPALKEVTGDAGYAVPAHDLGAIGSGIARLLEDKVLADTLSQRGIDRSANFSWSHCAKETLAVYSELRE